MRQTAAIFILAILFFENCNSVYHLNGKYANGYAGVSGEEIRFMQQPNRFEYFLRSEMGVLEYSTGSWVRNRNQVILNGFADSNIKALNVKSAITDNLNNKDKILIQYRTTSSLVKSVVVINNDAVVNVSSDTAFFSDLKIKVVQIKSYLSYTGLLSSSPKIDTLYSSKIELDNNGNKDMVLSFSVNQYDFVRTKLTDTITLKRNALLYHNKIKFKKVVR
jgi:hypothetical protein